MHPIVTAHPAESQRPPSPVSDGGPLSSAELAETTSNLIDHVRSLTQDFIGKGNRLQCLSLQMTRSHDEYSQLELETQIEQLASNGGRKAGNSRERTGLAKYSSAREALLRTNYNAADAERAKRANRFSQTVILRSKFILAIAQRLASQEFDIVRLNAARRRTEDAHLEIFPELHDRCLEVAGQGPITQKLELHATYLETAASHMFTVSNSASEISKKLRKFQQLIHSDNPLARELVTRASEQQAHHVEKFIVETALPAAGEGDAAEYSPERLLEKRRVLSNAKLRREILEENHLQNVTGANPAAPSKSQRKRRKKRLGLSRQTEQATCESVIVSGENATEDVADDTSTPKRSEQHSPGGLRSRSSSSLSLHESSGMPVAQQNSKEVAAAHASSWSMPVSLTSLRRHNSASDIPLGVSPPQGPQTPLYSDEATLSPTSVSPMSPSLKTPPTLNPHANVFVPMKARSQPMDARTSHSNQSSGSTENTRLFTHNQRSSATPVFTPGHEWLARAGELAPTFPAEQLTAEIWKSVRFESLHLDTTSLVKDTRRAAELLAWARAYDNPASYAAFVEMAKSALDHASALGLSHARQSRSPITQNNHYFHGNDVTMIASLDDIVNFGKTAAEKIRLTSVIKQAKKELRILNGEARTNNLLHKNLLSNGLRFLPVPGIGVATFTWIPKPRVRPEGATQEPASMQSMWGFGFVASYSGTIRLLQQALCKSQDALMRPRSENDRRIDLGTFKDGTPRSPGSPLVPEALIELQRRLHRAQQLTSPSTATTSR